MTKLRISIIRVPNLEVCVGPLLTSLFAPHPKRSLTPAVIKVLQLPHFFLPPPRGLLKCPCNSLISSGMTSVMHRPNILHHTWDIIQPPTSSPHSCYNASIHLFYCGKVPKTKELLLVTFGALTVLCNHHHDLVPELFHHPKGDPRHIKWSLLPPAPGNHEFTFCHHGFANSGHFKLMWHFISGIFHLVYCGVFLFLASPQDLQKITMKMQSLNHWFAREFPSMPFSRFSHMVACGRTSFLFTAG